MTTVVGETLVSCAPISDFTPAVTVPQDDPKYSSWFAKFTGFDDKTYPGGTQKDSMGKDTNGTFHVPTCDWYGTAAKPAKCSGFYHDQVGPSPRPTHTAAAGRRSIPLPAAVDLWSCALC